jgi:hypothetical protein
MSNIPSLYYYTILNGRCLYKWVPEGGPPEGVSLRVFLNLRRTHEYGNLHTHKQLPFYGNLGTHKNRRMSPWHNALGFFS